MKSAKLCLVLVLALLTFSGCQRRNEAGAPSTSNPVVDNVSEYVSERVESGIHDFASVAGEDASRIAYDVSDLDDDESLPERDGDESTLRERLEDADSSLPTEDREESATPAMSTDFAEIGALNREKLGWGSGGPTDDTGRPEGATTYQKKYGKYGAYFIAPSNQNVYLTFDEGYENGYTPAILDILKEKDVQAVFFITLDFARQQPELVKRMIAEGHVIGNHSCKHLSFPDMPLEDAAEDIMKLHNYVKDNFYYEMHLFRPPMGEFSEQTLALVQSLGYKSVFWSFAYMDYDVDNQPITIDALNKITSKCHPGSIYLLHAVSQTNAEILDEAIDAITGMGFRFAKWDW